MRAVPLIFLLATFGCRNDEKGGDGTTEDTGGADTGDDYDTNSEPDDCGDGDPATYPGAEEVCDGIDNDCDGDVDEGVLLAWYADADGDGTDDDGLPDLDASGIDDCKEVAVVVTYGFHVADASYTCEGVSMVERELQEIEALLAELGLSPVFFTDNLTTGITTADLSPYPVVLYDNGGWSAAGSSSTVSALEDAAATGKGLMFLGDDVMKHATNTQTAWGTSALFDLSYTTGYTSNGVGPTTVSVATSSHEVMDGPWGTVGDFVFEADIDVGSAAGAGETVLMTGAGSSPVVLAADDGGQRTVTAIIGVYNSATCPISDEDGLGEIGVLFQNAVWWLGGWQ